MRKKRRSVFEDSTKEIALLSRYYPVDTENKLVTLQVNAENADDLLEEPAAPGLRASFKTDFFESCQDLMEKFPAPYRLNAEITVKDWGSHTPKELARSLADTLEMRQNTKRLNSRSVLFLAAMFVLAGFTILGLMVCGQEMGWFGEGFKAGIWQEGVDTAGTVFIWEAITVVFLQTSEESISERGIRKLLANLTFCAPDGTVLLNLTDKQLFRNSQKELTTKQVIQVCLLASSCALAVSGIIEPLYMIQGTHELPMSLKLIFRTVVIVGSALQLLAGVGGFFLFWGRKNGFTSFAKGYALISLLLVAFQLVYETHSLIDLMSNLVSCCFRLLFIFSLLLLAKEKRRAQKKESK